MLEQNEPGTAGDNTNNDQNSPSDTLPPRRRRRAASRPAGPPVGAQNAEPAGQTAEPAAPVAVESAADEAPAPRTRRRATRKATAPAGAPQAVETAETAGVAEAVEAPASPESAASVESAADEAPAPRTRRRATRKATAPAGAPQAVVSAEAVETPAPVESAAVADSDEAAPAPRTRRRATRKVTAPAGAPKAAEDLVEAAPAPVVVAAPESVEEAAAEESAAPAPRARRRATRKATAPQTTVEAPVVADVTELDEAEEAEEAEEIAAVEVPVVEDEAPRGLPRGLKGQGGAPIRRRAARPASAPQFTPVEPAPQAAPEDEEPTGGRSRRRATRPAVAVFQAPVFTEPMFQTPETAAAAAAAARVEEPAEAEEAAVEAAEPVAAEPQGRSRRRRRRGEPAEPVLDKAAEEPVEEHVEEAAEAEADVESEDSDDDRPSRRRRRGGRRRRRGESAEAEDAAEEQAYEPAEQTEPVGGAESEEEDEEHEDEDGTPSAAGTSSSRRRRRRRRRTGDAGPEGEPGSDDPERTVVKVREPRPARERAESTSSDEVQSIKGSTRLEAKKQRRREGREQGRRRVPIITEAEFLARREAVERVMVVRQHGERTQIGVLEDNVLVEHYVNKEQATSYVGNVYLGKVQNVLPSMEAAFVDIGKGRNAVLYAGEVNFESLGMGNGPRRIEAALKSGQSVLVQVTKDPIGHKGARLTSQVSLPGRYLVYVPEGSMTGISRKLPDTERARLKTILKKIVPEDAGVIVRTAAEGASEDELRRDVERLQAQWADIQKKANQISTSSPSLLYGEPDMTVRVVRDIFNEDFSKVIVSGDEAWETIHGYVSHVAPDLADRLSRWTSEVDVFATYRIDEQLAKALDRKVWLPSGGSLVIDKTEAMIVVDVNTGKFTGQGGNLEETVTRNNLEAAEEIVRQLRLRDLGGIVVIDFIDMVLESNRDLVLRRLLECLGRDRTKHQVAEVTSLGLVQMTRKRVGQGLLESFSETCVHCNGRGVIVHMEQPTSAGGGAGKRPKKRGRGGAEHDQHIHEHEAVEIAADVDHEAVESEAEVAAEIAAPVALAEPEFVPDEELYSSVAEAEAAARGGLRGLRGQGGTPSRRRATRRASAPAGAPRAAAAEAPAAPVEEPEAPQAVTVASFIEDEAPRGRTRRRATRKVSAPAGAPKPAAAEPVVVVTEPEPKAEEPVAEQVVAVAEPVVEEAPVAAPPRARRRATRKATAPAGSPSGAEDAAIVVVAAAPAAEPEAPVAEPAESAEPAEAAAPAKKAARKTAKKATAKKAATKKTAAKKTVAKKTTAKKAAAKKTTAAAEQQQSSVSASTDS
ncbi:MULTISPECIES: Rne/Rng family ribonuclease [unclassified Streptomyces]|uniref:Rne/Rng family ribonuclease n=1 Tax=unclassified Streptomyces TaxID=2593676 RepID=UPI0038233329